MHGFPGGDGWNLPVVGLMFHFVGDPVHHQQCLVGNEHVKRIRQLSYANQESLAKIQNHLDLIFQFNEDRDPNQNFIGDY